jgi:hypothetical protein
MVPTSKNLSPFKLKIRRLAGTYSSLKKEPFIEKKFNTD